MKRRLIDDEPPTKKRKLDDAKDENDPSIITPELKVLIVQNGIVQIDFVNTDSYFEQEMATHQLYEFELLYRRNDNEWKSFKYDNHTIDCYDSFYLKSSKDIQDYTLRFKLRARLKQKSKNEKWSPFCDELTVQIKSSLIAHQFKVGQYVEFRDENEYYSREGKIIQIMSENKVKIRPFPKHFTQPNDDDDDEDDDGKEDEDEHSEWQNYADLDYFLDFDDNHNRNLDEEGDVNMDALAQIIDFGNDNDAEGNSDRLNEFRRYLVATRAKNRSKDIVVDCSRLYGDGIRLSAVIDISDNEQNVDQMVLLRSNDEGIMSVFNALKCALNEYVKEERFEFDEHYQLKYMVRFIGKNVCDYLISGSDQFKWKLGCLRDSSDGKMELNAVRSDIINARIEGLKAGIDGMNKYDIDCVIGFCDICRLEISEYDWRYNCEQHITNKHDVCMTCAYNVINQYIQFNRLLHPLLEKSLNDDCIQEITSFVVGSVVKL